MQSPVSVFSQAGCCGVVASSDADSRMPIRWAQDDTLVMLVNIHKCLMYLAFEKDKVELEKKLIKKR